MTDLEMSVTELRAMLEAGQPLTLLDVREPWEVALGTLRGAVAIRLGELAARWPEAGLTGDIVVICHHGVRSLHAATWLRSQGVPACSLAGGTDAWSREVDPSLPRY
jgi:rhodanese-related sulfurtransferase